jgi:hypothetical protein
MIFSALNALRCGVLSAPNLNLHRNLSARASTLEARSILASTHRFNTKRQDFRRFYKVGRN